MDKPLAIPGLKSGSVKQVILSILSSEWPLSLVKIHRKAISLHNLKVSYQGIRFAMNELLEDGMVRKVGKEFLLNQEWIEHLAAFAENLKDNYSDRPSFKSFNLETTQLTAHNLAEMADFLLYAMEHDLFDTENKRELYMMFVHLWIPYANKSKRERLRKHFKQNRIFCLCQEKTFGDVILGKYFRNWGQEVKVGVPLHLTADTWVHGDCVIQIYIPDRIRKKMEKAYQLSKDILSFDKIDKLTEMTFEKTSIEIVITRNPNVAKKIKQQVLKHFKK